MKNRILDNYITKKFILALVLSLCGFVFIYVITNLFENIGYFVDRKASVLTVLNYYLLFTPKIIVLLMPLATLMGIYFSLGLITKHNEALAIRGLGISPFRIYKPIFFYGFMVSVLVLIFNLSLVPRSKELLTEFKRKKIDKIEDFTKLYSRNINYMTDEGKIVGISRLNDNFIFEVFVLDYEGGKLVSRIDAEKGEWKDSVWVFSEVYIRNFDGDMIKLKFEDEKPIYDFKASPDELVRSKHNPVNLPLSDLLNYIGKLDRSGQKSDAERIELFERISYPFVSTIILLFGCPLALEVKRRGLLFGFGLGILSSFTFWGIIQLFKELGIKGSLSPWLSILIPDILFLSLGLYFMLKKEYS
jgi:lipopolysaccharide export system permease protein